jgi:carbonic anhydrase/acetyltransferase-like protein (isoleucine patch superfamily)
VDITHRPELIHPTACVAPNSTIGGKVHVAARASIWFSSALRGDNAPPIIDERRNVQDLSMIHINEGEPCALGAGVMVGHRAWIYRPLRRTRTGI